MTSNEKLSTTKLRNFLRSTTFILVISSSDNVVVYIVHKFTSLSYKFVNNVDYHFIGRKMTKTIIKILENLTIHTNKIMMSIQINLMKYN
jgi:hypothetical protein